METSTVANAAFIVSIVAGVVGIFNLAATSAKLKLDLYNRHFKIYEDVLAGAVQGRMDFEELLLELETKLSKYLDFRKINGICAK